MLCGYVIIIARLEYIMSHISCRLKVRIAFLAGWKYRSIKRECCLQFYDT